MCDQLRFLAVGVLHSLDGGSHFDSRQRRWPCVR
jgi:hypothetical protein